MSIISPVASTDFTISAVGLGLVSFAVVGGVLSNYVTCSNATKNLHDTETGNGKRTKTAKDIARGMYRFGAPIYAMLMFVLSALVFLTAYIFRITGFLTITTDTTDLVDVNVWIAYAVGAAIYMLSSRWIAGTHWPQVIVATITALGSPLLMMAAELLHADTLFLRVLLVIFSGLLAIVAILAILWPLNFICKTRSREKARKGAKRAGYIGLGIFAYFVIWVTAVAGGIFDHEVIGYSGRGLIQMIVAVFVHVIFLTQFVAYLFRKADEHASNSSSYTRA